MKLFTIPFLFFCAINSSISEFKTDLFFQETDSITYYASIANDPKTNTEHPKAFKFYSRLKQQNLKQGDTIKTVNNLRQIAIIQNNWGDYYASEASVAEALTLLENLKRTDSVLVKIKIGLYNQIGRINHALLKYESALSYFEKGLQMATSQGYINIIKNNMALVLRDQGNYDQAETVFLEVYDSRLKTKDTLRIARALNNLAKVRAKLNKPEAYNNLMEALNMRLRHNDVIGSYSSYKNLSIYYSDSANTTEALRYANEALSVAKQLNQASYLEDALSLIIGLNQDENVMLYKHIKDSLDTVKQIQENKNALLKYNVGAEQKKVQEGELQREKVEKEKLLAQAITLLILLLSLLLYVVLRSRHKKENLQQVYNTEARISKKVHDEVANEVYHVMTKVQGKPGVDVLDDLEHIYTKTRDISKDNSFIDFNSNFEDTINDLLLSYRNETVGVITKGIKTINWNSISNIKKTTIYRVLQELMTNMKKHSHATVTVISFSKNKGKLHINYNDNGNGCELKKQVGLQNTESRMESINGTIRFESQINNGFKAIMSI